MHIQRIIERLGYKPNEAKVYLAALSLGECTVSDIAAKVKLPRTSTQVIVDELHRAGIMNFYVKRRFKYWTAEHPEKLLVELREREIALRTVMPTLNALEHADGGKPLVKVFSGAEDIKLIMEDILATQRHILAILSWDDWINLFGNEYMDDFVEMRVRHFLKIRLLTPKTDFSLKLKEQDSMALRETRFLTERAHINTTNFIYGDKVAIISLNKKQPTGVLIEDADVRHTSTIFFECLWRLNTE